MAQELDDGKFWLPSEFLTDDDLLTDFKTAPRSGNSNVFRGNFWWDLSSPVESINGVSTETESDEDDGVPGFTQKRCFSSYSPFSDYTAAKLTERKMYGSPQSTLTPNWDLLYAAAAEVARIKMAKATPPPPPPLRTPSPAATPFYINKSQNDAAGRLAYLQLQFQIMKQQQIIGSRQAAFPSRHSPATFSLPTPQQSFHQLPTKKERNGTGVFLPRPLSATVAETRKKQVGVEKEVGLKRGFPATNQEIRLPKEWIY